MADMPSSWPALEVIAVGLKKIAAAKFDGRREYLRAHRAVIDADDGLRERELRKMSILSEAIDRGFRDRGEDELTAALAAHSAVTVLGVALDRWFDAADGEDGAEGASSLADHVSDAITALKSLSAPGNRATPTA